MSASKGNLLLATALLVALTGCALGPDYQRPELTVPQRFRGDAPPALDPTVDTALAESDWATVYTDPALRLLIQQALAGNLDVQIAAARIEQARATAGATGLVLFPQVSLSADRTRNKQSELAVGAPNIPRDLTTNRVSLTATWEIDLWGRLRRSTEAARAELLGAGYARRGVVVGLIGDVATAYYSLQALDEQLAITRRTIGTREKFVELTQARHERGVISGLDVATAEAQAAAARANLPELQRQITLVEDQLSLLLGGYPAAIARGEATHEPGHELSPEPPAGLSSSLLERRPDLLLAESRLKAANARVGVAKAALFPRLALTGTFGTASQSLGDLFTQPSNAFSFGGNLLQPLLDAERNLYQVDLADARKREAILSYEQAVKGAFREVADSLAERSQYEAFEHEQDARVSALRRADGIALARYRIGFSSYFDVINAERDLFDSELALTAARRNTRLAAVRLYRALGGGWAAAASEEAKN
ncbi:efflux transporter outer membrane subunit [Nevskia sp.]|uniref:efflux transporter outer membrane subunit n=1 Tax=Nevskia sp. TaxID=1929292 RepID=UPI0025F24E97|nr:efflux transporter outer membrane subunit [Nevskia sp.]